MNVNLKERKDYMVFGDNEKRFTKKIIEEGIEYLNNNNILGRKALKQDSADLCKIIADNQGSTIEECLTIYEFQKEGLL